MADDQLPKVSWPDPDEFDDLPTDTSEDDKCGGGGDDGGDGGGGSPPGEPSAAPPWASDEFLALQFIERYGDTVRFEPDKKEWWRWTGKRWEVMKGDRIVELSRAMVTEFTAKLDNGRQARDLASAKTCFGIIRMVKTSGLVEIDRKDFERHPKLLNTPAGTYDMISGEMRPHRREDFLTHITPVSPTFGRPERFLKALAHACGGDQPDSVEAGQLLDFLQKLAGYAATGETREEKFFFLWGSGQNGKGTYLHPIRIALGPDLADSCGSEVFMESRNDRHPTELTVLDGPRMIIASETQRNRRWNDVLLKQVSGRDQITARYMHKDGYRFEPICTLIFMGNNRPVLTNVDPAIRRRLVAIHFKHEVSKEDCNRDLRDEIVDNELSDLLGWVLEGARMYYSDGKLILPDVVQAASEEYLEGEDLVGQWMEDCIIHQPGGFSTYKELFQSWKKYCEDQGGYVGDQRRLTEALLGRGFNRGRRRDARGIEGLVVGL